MWKIKRETSINLGVIFQLLVISKLFFTPYKIFDIFMKTYEIICWGGTLFMLVFVIMYVTGKVKLIKYRNLENKVKPKYTVNFLLILSISALIVSIIIKDISLSLLFISSYILSRAMKYYRENFYKAG